MFQLLDKNPSVEDRNLLAQHMKHRPAMQQKVYSLVDVTRSGSWVTGRIRNMWAGESQYFKCLELPMGL